MPASSARTVSTPSTRGLINAIRRRYACMRGLIARNKRESGEGSPLNTTLPPRAPATSRLELFLNVNLLDVKRTRTSFLNLRITLPLASPLPSPLAVFRKFPKLFAEERRIGEWFACRSLSAARLGELRRHVPFARGKFPMDEIPFESSSSLYRSRLDQDRSEGRFCAK